MTQQLEQQLLEELKQGKDVSLERALLILSGCESEEEITEYQHKIGRIHQGYREWINSDKVTDPVKKIKYLTALLWTDYPDRESATDNLLQLIDNWYANLFSGNCVGNSQFLSIIGLREGLDLGIIYDTKHVANCLFTNSGPLIIENTAKGRLYPLREFEQHHSETVGNDTIHIASIKELISRVLISRAYERCFQGKTEQAMSDCNWAILLSPHMSDAYYTRSLVWWKQGKSSEEIDDLNKAIELDPYHNSAIFNRGVSNFEQGKLNQGIEDMQFAHELNPRNQDIYEMLYSTIRKVNRGLAAA